MSAFVLLAPEEKEWLEQSSGPGFSMSEIVRYLIRAAIENCPPELETQIKAAAVLQKKIDEHEASKKE